MSKTRRCQRATSYNEANKNSRKLTLCLEKRQGSFNREGLFIRINKVSSAGSCLRFIAKNSVFHSKKVAQ